MAEAKTKRKKNAKRTEDSGVDRFVRLTNGSEYKLTGEDGKYFVCGEKRFAVNSPYVDCVYEKAAEATEMPAEEADPVEEETEDGDS